MKFGCSGDLRGAEMRRKKDDQNRHLIGGLFEKRSYGVLSVKPTERPCNYSIQQHQRSRCYPDISYIDRSRTLLHAADQQ